MSRVQRKRAIFLDLALDLAPAVRGDPATRVRKSHSGQHALAHGIAAARDVLDLPMDYEDLAGRGLQAVAGAESSSGFRRDCCVETRFVLPDAHVRSGRFDGSGPWTGYNAGKLYPRRTYHSLRRVDRHTAHLIAVASGGVVVQYAKFHRCLDPGESC